MTLKLQTKKPAVSQQSMTSTESLGTRWEKVDCWVIYEYSPSDVGDIRRVVIIRDRYEDAVRILTAIKETEVNFGVYTLEGYSYKERS